MVKILGTCEICDRYTKIYQGSLFILDQTVEVSACWDCWEGPWYEHPSQRVLDVVAKRLPLTLREVKKALCEIVCQGEKQEKCLYFNCPYLLDDLRAEAKARSEKSGGPTENKIEYNEF